jgi:NAD(P)-dependent dehydrogenase (short-subunit alcohol dehydrogenase family)
MKNYLVIGGSSAVGRSLVKSLLDEGHMVYASYNQRKIDVESERLVKFSLNVLDQDDLAGFLPNVLNGFAYLPGAIQLKPFKRLKAEAFREDFELQVLGAIKALQTALDPLTRSDSAAVLFYSTVAVQRGFDFHSLVAASKGALEGLTRSLAAELAPKIRVNCIAPSLTRSPLAERFINSEKKLAHQAEAHPLNRIGEPHDIASLSRFLLSEDAAWITGQIMHVDGGRSALD